MLSDQHRDLVSATVPALRAHGGEITRVFYRDMLADHPELFDYFNPANQRDGGQAASLAASVLAYASHIANPAPLSGMIERISSKHVSLEIKPAHYPIVGRYLLNAIKVVLGDAATPEIIEAWSAAYGQLAAIMIDRETTLAEKGASQPQGWRGTKPFRISRKVQESEVTASFYLEPVDGAALPAFLPGQYVSLRVRVPGFAHYQVRQYSLSCASNGRDYRISVRREATPPDVAGAPPGLVSNWLHDAVHEGAILDVHVPLGDFVLKPGDHPVVLLSGGSGITAVLSMLEHLTGKDGGNREVVFLHGARHRGHHAFGAHVRALARSRPGVRVSVVYGEAGSDDELGVHHDAVGNLTADILRAQLPTDPADFYYCGPIGFMAGVEAALDTLGVPQARRFSEAFAPDPSFAVTLSSEPDLLAAE
jgi:nitric oxide dioxygenase